MSEHLDEDDAAERAARAEFARALTQHEATKAPVESAVGARVRGVIVSIGEEHAFVDYGARSEGALAVNHLEGAEGARRKVGDALDLYVVALEPQVTLAPSLKADAGLAQNQLREAQRLGLPVEGKVIGLNGGGLEIDLSGVRGFCPFSQIEIGYVADPSVWIGRAVEVLVQEIDGARGGAVVSRRKLLEQEREEGRQRLLGTLKEGLDLDGTVARLEPFGAFVDIGGMDGLVHVSEISHRRVEHPSDLLSVGQKVRVKVLRLEMKDPARPKLSLSMKASEPDPWAEVAERFWKGRRVSGLVVRLTDFGAFVELAPGIDGLVHISEAALHPVVHVKEVLAPQQQVEAVVLEVDLDKKRISLSIREALATTSEGESLTAERAPQAGDAVDGFVAGIKPYGLFVDLPEYGHRTRGLIPREETGERPGSDLSRRFAIGDKLRVEVLDVTEGKIRLSLTRLKNREDNASAENFARENISGRAPATGMAEAFKRASEKKPR